MNFRQFKKMALTVTENEEDPNSYRYLRVIFIDLKQ